ncbi:alpha/beta hydrolase [Planctomycetota bacterium]
MKKNRRRFRFGCLLTIIPLSLWACVNRQWTPRTYPHALVTADGTVTAITDFRKQLNAIVNDIHQNEDANNIILFIHGRGKHPGKAFRQKLLADLESDYSAKVIMFHWPAWDGVLGFPEAQARAAATDFIAVLNQLQTCQNEPAHPLEGIRFTLLTQSMGSLVLEESVHQWGNHNMPRLFDTIILSAPASATQGHAQWLNRISLSDHIYTTTHRHDPVLSSAEIYTRQARLGKRLPMAEEPNSLASRVIYLDVTPAWVAHRYYLHRYLRFTPHLKEFYDRILNGLPAVLTPENGIASTGHPQVFKLGKGLTARGGKGAAVNTKTDRN